MGSGFDNLLIAFSARTSPEDPSQVTQPCGELRISRQPGLKTLEGQAQGRFVAPEETGYRLERKTGFFPREVCDQRPGQDGFPGSSAPPNSAPPVQTSLVTWSVIVSIETFTG